MAGNPGSWAARADVALIAAACSAADPVADDKPQGEETAMAAVFAGDEWPRAHPRELGFDPGRLDELDSEGRAIGSYCVRTARITEALDG